MKRREFLAGAAAAAAFPGLYDARAVRPDLLEVILNAWKGFQKRAQAAAEVVRAHLFISGIVQGVSYRASTQVEAQKCGVVGWVKNLEDGRVEAVLQGPRTQVEEVIRWCHRGPPAAKVEKVAVAWEKAADEFKAFDVRY